MYKEMRSESYKQKQVSLDGVYDKERSDDVLLPKPNLGT
jgi:hypothetical protein